MHEINKVSGSWVAAEGRKSEFIGLPSGEFIRPENVEAVRVIPDRADRGTGQVSSRVGIDHRGSWYMIHFDHVDDAKAYALALATLCNKVRRGEDMGDEPRGRSFGRREVQGFIEGLQGDASKHGAPGDSDDVEREE